MDYPKLKNPVLCRLTPYAVVLGVAAIPIVAVFLFPVHDVIRIIVLFCALGGLLVYIIRNFLVLMSMDMMLAQLCLERTARTQYSLPNGRTPKAILKRLSRVGTKCDPISMEPRPLSLRYRFTAPLTIYNQGVERVITVFETDLLTQDTYRRFLRVAKANSNSLIGRKKALFLDHQQKKSPLYRVTVVVILAKSIDPGLCGTLYKLVSQTTDDEETNSIVPCIIDLGQNICCFDCLGVPYIGFSYAAKNHGIRLVKKCVFGGRLPLQNNRYYIRQDNDYSPDDTVWKLWKELRHQLVGEDKQTQRQFEAMGEGEILVRDMMLYLKWDSRGISQVIKMDKENLTVTVESVTDWAYPKANPISKKLRSQLQDRITTYYKNQGYTVQFADLLDMDVFE